MSPSNKQIIERGYRAISEGDLAGLGALMADDMIEHEELPGFAQTKEGALGFFGVMRQAFPDLSMTADDMVAEGEKVCIRGTMRGTHRGEFMGIPATGRSLSVPFFDLMRVRDGKIAEHWGLTDTETMMRQLGVLED